MGDCIDCGTTVENKNSAGHYRDRCIDCIDKVAEEVRNQSTGWKCEDCGEKQEGAGPKYCLNCESQNITFPVEVDS